MTGQAPVGNIRVAVYGKGGVGKSFVSSNLCVLLARSGREVALVGCDPKGDSSRNLVGSAGALCALPHLLSTSNPPQTVDELIVTGVENVGCIEAGGPEPGEGCGGMGVLKLFQFLDKQGFLSDCPYDSVVFDVLGDVVCGGFAAPMKFAAPLDVLVVVSEEVHSMYAANRIALAVNRYALMGVRFAGLVVNRRQQEGSIEHVRQFAAELGTDILAVIPRSPAVFRADTERTPAILHENCGQLRPPFQNIVNRLTNPDSETTPAVTPLSTEEFDRLMSRFGAI